MRVSANSENLTPYKHQLSSSTVLSQIFRCNS